MTVRSCFTCSIFSKALIDCYIGSPPLAIILRSLARVVIKRPESTIRKTFVVITYFLARQVEGNIVQPIMFERAAIPFRAPSPTDPHPFVFTKDGHQCRNESTRTCLPWTLGRRAMHRQSIRNDDQVTAPVIYTYSGSIRRTQGQSLLTGSHRKIHKTLQLWLE